MKRRSWTLTAPYKSRRQRVFSWFAGKCYVLGLASGGCSSWSGNIYSHAIYWTGKRVYILGWERGNWRCLLRFHHWPTKHKVAWDMCGKCAPWPCCGSTAPNEGHHCPTYCAEMEHRDCLEHTT